MPHSDMHTTEIHKRKFKKNLAILLAVFGMIALIWAVTMVKMASAADVLACGAPIEGTVAEDPDMDYCDIYQRQIDYHGKHKALRESIKARAKAYEAPRQEARRAYEQALQAHHASMGE